MAETIKGLLIPANLFAPCTMVDLAGYVEDGVFNLDLAPMRAHLGCRWVEHFGAAERAPAAAFIDDFDATIHRFAGWGDEEARLTVRPACNMRATWLLGFATFYDIAGDIIVSLDDDDGGSVGLPDDYLASVQSFIWPARPLD